MDPNDDRLLPLDDHNPNCNEPSLDNSKSTKPKKGRCLRYLNITCINNLLNRIIFLMTIEYNLKLHANYIILDLEMNESITILVLRRCTL